VDKTGICSQGDCTVLLIWKIHLLKDFSLSLVKNITSNHMKCVCFPSGTLGFVCCTVRLTVNSLTHRFINVINHEFWVFCCSVVEDMIMHQQVIRSWYSKAMQWPYLYWSRCPSSGLVTHHIPEGWNSHFSPPFQHFPS
jgi:hypothetical protein